MTTGRFHGAFTALVTPFKNGKIDEEAYREFIEWQIEQGIDGLVPCGTTGESATMTHDEHEAAIRICVEQVNKRVPVIAGAGSNNTREAIPLTQFAKNVGADAALHITPYYNKPTQEGLYQHFKTICSEVSMPVILYNVPGRTGCNMLPPTVARIARDVPDVVGIKEATADLIHVSDLVEQCPEGFQILSGRRLHRAAPHRRGRLRRHLRDRERRAQADGRPLQGHPRRGYGRSQAPALQAHAHQPGHVP